MTDQTAEPAWEFVARRAGPDRCDGTPASGYADPPRPVATWPD